MRKWSWFTRGQVWPALTWLRKFHQDHQQVLARHLFLVDRLQDGLLLEEDASTPCGGAACWIGARRVAHRNPPVAYVVTKWTEEDEELLGTQREDPAHRQSGKRSWCCWPIANL